MLVGGGSNAWTPNIVKDMMLTEAIGDAEFVLYDINVTASDLVKAWLEEHVDRIEIFYLPSYAPDLNPDERLNADMKHAISSKVPVRTKAKLKVAAQDHMALIDRSPERVRAYFHDPRVKYAA